MSGVQGGDGDFLAWPKLEWTPPQVTALGLPVDRVEEDEEMLFDMDTLSYACWHAFLRGAATGAVLVLGVGLVAAGLGKVADAWR